MDTIVGFFTWAIGTLFGAILGLASAFLIEFLKSPKISLSIGTPIDSMLGQHQQEPSG